MKPRTFRVPDALVASFGSNSTTLDDLETLRFDNGPRGVWTRRVLAGENNKTLAALSPRTAAGFMPNVVTVDNKDHGQVVVALRDEDYGYLTKDGWSDDFYRPGASEYTEVDPDDVAFFARSFFEGADCIVIKPQAPKAFLAAAAEAPAGEAIPEPSTTESGLPSEALYVAVVDELDNEAVLEVLAITKGPFVFRRHDGKWESDEGMLSVLKSVSPPPTTTIEPAMLPKILEQVDEATKSDPFVETEHGKDMMQASAANQLAVEMVLLAATKNRKSALSAANDIAGRMPTNLQRYWTIGEGAAKIRWGTPGAMTRCSRYLRKYVGPHRAYQTCNNLGKKLGGKGVAWDVLSR